MQIGDLSATRHIIKFAPPKIRMLALFIFIVARPTQGVVDHGDLVIAASNVGKVIPAQRDIADLLLAFQPLELMQLKPGGCVDILGRQGRAFGVIEQNAARPVLFLIPALVRTQKLLGFGGHVPVLGTHYRITIITQCPELGNIIQHHHVVIDE